MGSLVEIPKNRLFKWVGGKTWLKDTLCKHSKNNSSIYIEPFVGGMGAFFAIYPNLKNIDTIVLNDINSVLIGTYQQVKDNPEKLIKKVIILEKNYLKTVNEKAYKLHKTRDKEELKIILSNSNNYFRDMRDRFNEIKNKKVGLEVAALFLFLSEHSFNSVYRENSRGRYNTPFNWDNKIINLEKKKNDILEYSKFFNSINIIFENLSVFDILDKYPKENTFVYFDPPYLNKESGSENKYTKSSFGKYEQLKLLDYLPQYKDFLYSNHSIDLFKEHFNDLNIAFLEIPRKNIMSACKDSRKNDILEILAFS